MSRILCVCETFVDTSTTPDPLAFLAINDTELGRRLKHDGSPPYWASPKSPARPMMYLCPTCARLHIEIGGPDQRLVYTPDDSKEAHEWLQRVRTT
jgi:hypothetical protein